ncbi:MAG: hypothetical protein KAR31_13265, partial [Candidatus Omnitrophica bacterium]|nr:hypothetical protein [Candidatus Omnitrophota bacterium]
MARTGKAYYNYRNNLWSRKARGRANILLSLFHGYGSNGRYYRALNKEYREAEDNYGYIMPNSILFVEHIKSLAMNLERMHRIDREEREALIRAAYLGKKFPILKGEQAQEYFYMNMMSPAYRRPPMDTYARHKQMATHVQSYNEIVGHQLEEYIRMGTMSLMLDRKEIREIEKEIDKDLKKKKVEWFGRFDKIGNIITAIKSGPDFTIRETGKNILKMYLFVKDGDKNDLIKELIAGGYVDEYGRVDMQKIRSQKGLVLDPVGKFKEDTDNKIYDALLEEGDLINIVINKIIEIGRRYDDGIESNMFGYLVRTHPVEYSNALKALRARGRKRGGKYENIYNALADELEGVDEQTDFLAIFNKYPDAYGDAAEIFGVVLDELDAANMAVLDSFSRDVIAVHLAAAYNDGNIDYRHAVQLADEEFGSVQVAYDAWKEDEDNIKEAMKTSEEARLKYVLLTEFEGGKDEDGYERKNYKKMSELKIFQMLQMTTMWQNTNPQNSLFRRLTNPVTVVEKGKTITL